MGNDDIDVIHYNKLLSGDYVPQVTDDTNDTIFYEVGRYIELLKSSNPNILELTFFDDRDLYFINDGKLAKWIL